MLLSYHHVRNYNIDPINEYSRSIIANKGKLKNHPEEVEFEDIVRIYSKSLLEK